MALSDYQLQYVTTEDSLLMGAGTNIDLVRIEGLFGNEMRVGDREFARLSGDIPGIYRAYPREVTIQLEVRGDPSLSTYWDLVDKVDKIFSEIPEYRTGDKLEFKFPSAAEKFIRARTIRKRFDRSWETEYGLAPFDIMLRASDPRAYSATFNSGGGSGTFNITNLGGARAYPKLTFSQAGTALLTNNTTGIYIHCTGQAGGSLVCDMDKMVRGEPGLIVYVGTTDSYQYWQNPRTPFYLAPGANSLTLNAGSSVTVQYYDTWI